MSLRILHVTPYSPWAWAYGGIPRLASTLTRALARQGHEVTVCTTDAYDDVGRLPPTPGDRTRRPSEIRTALGVRWRVFPNVSNSLAYHWQFFTPRGLRRYLVSEAGSFDVAHIHACRNLLGSMAAHYLRRAGVPYVLAPNGTAPLIERRRLAKRLFDVVAGRRDLEGAHCVLAVSQAERVQLARLGVPATAIRVIPNPIDLEEFETPPVRGRFRQRFALGSAPLVLFLGKQTPRKRVDVLVRAFAKLARTDARLVIAGNDMGTGRRLRSLVRSLGLAERAVFTGLLRGPDRLEALADADVLVYPSQDEVFGLVPLEALLAGTPVIVADDSGCGELIGSMGGGQVVPLGDADQLAHAIERVLEAPLEWREIAAAAALRVRATAGGDVVGAAIADLYRQLTADA